MTAPTISKNPYNTKGNTLNYANGEMAHWHDSRIASLTLHSTAIAYWAYDTESKTLTVEYKSTPNKFYYYEGVPFQVVFDLMLADSLGQFIAKVVKPNYSVA